jgi:hypothetical protein
MSTDVRVEVTIAKPPAVVAAFMFDPRNDATWTSGVVRVRPLDEGRLRNGSRVERTARFFGREFSYVYEVVDAGEEFVEMKVDEPFPMRIRYQLDERDGGTRASIHARGDARGFYKLAAPLLNVMVRRSIRKDLDQLKKFVEAIM